MRHPAVWLTAALAVSPVQLEWDAPPSCPSEAAVRARIEQQLAARTPPEALRIRARVIAPSDPDGPWRLDLELGDRGQRQVAGQSCDALVDAAAVMVGISVDEQRERAHPKIPDPPASVSAPVDPAPSVRDPAVTPDPTTAEPAAAVPPSAAIPNPGAAERPDPSSPTPDSVSVDAADPSPSAREPDPPTSEPSPSSLRVVLGLMTGVHGVGLPGVGAGLGGRLGVQWRALRVALYGAHWFERDQPVQRDVAASYRLGVGGLELCGVWILGRATVFELLGCGLGEAGMLRAQGIGALSPRVQARPWLALGGGAGGAWRPRPWLSVGLRLDLLGLLLRDEFLIGAAPAGRTGPLDVRGLVTVDFHLPTKVSRR